MRKEINYLGLTKIKARELWIIGFSLGIFFLIARIFSPNSIIIGGLAPILGLFIGSWIVKLLRKKQK